MAASRLLVFVSIALVGFCWGPEVFGLESDRGRLLYENNCQACHESVVHVREDRKVQTIDELLRQVQRWSKQLRVQWQRDEVLDVTGYLNRRFYKLNGDE